MGLVTEAGLGVVGVGAFLAVDRVVGREVKKEETVVEVRG